MSAALISISILAVALVATAEPPLSVIGEGFLTKPFTINAPPGKGMRYAGPVVYTNEKPPIIYFPPPPKDAKPGLGVLFKGKSPKSIKYVPMPHHDLPVLIYTSDKMPPIHVVHPPKNEKPPPFRKLKEFGSLSSTYRGIIPEATSGNIYPSGSVVSSTYEIPSTTYGSPVKAFNSAMNALGSLGSMDFTFAASPISTQPDEMQYEEFSGFGYRGLSPPPPVSELQSAPSNQRPSFKPSGVNKKPPHILYNGQPPIHVFNEPEMFVQAPKEIPLKTYADMPPKASFGPSKSSFGPPSVNSFGATLPYRQSFLNSPYPRPSTFRENMITSASSQNPTNVLPPPSNSPKTESSQGPGQAQAQSHGRPPTYSFNPPQTVYSFGPFSIEYGPPSEPFMSYSEPVGSLSSIYGAINNGERGKGDASASAAINGATDDGWLPGKGPISENSEGHVMEEAYGHASMPPPLPHLRRPHSLRGPRPSYLQQSVLIPSGASPSLFGGSRLAHLLSAFKLKRSKVKYAIAPKSMHKPPIIIYYGKKPPIHVYEKPDEENNVAHTSGSSTSTITVTSIESPSYSDGRGISSNDNSGNSEAALPSTSFDNGDLTYGSSQKAEIRVAAPSPTTPSGGDEKPKPAIIPAKPVDIFTSPELHPSIYKARNSLNTILVSDLSGSGGSTIKTYIVRNNNEGSPESVSAYSVQQDEREKVGNNKNERRSIPFAQDRISGIVAAEQIPIVSNIPVSENEQVEQDVKNNESNNTEDLPPTIVLAIGTPPETEQPEQKEQVQSQEASETEPVVAAAIQSPSSFQTSLSQAEKDAEEAAEASSSS